MCAVRSYHPELATWNLAVEVVIVMSADASAAVSKKLVGILLTPDEMLTSVVLPRYIRAPEPMIVGNALSATPHTIISPGLTLPALFGHSAAMPAPRKDAPAWET